VVRGSIAYYGTYTVNDAEKTITVHIERSSFPNLNGTDGKRILALLSADETKYTNPVGGLEGLSIAHTSEPTSIRRDGAANYGQCFNGK
jgi:hypothetical protein